MITRSTQQARYGHVLALLRWCLKRDYLTQDPLGDVATPDKPANLPKAVRREGLDAICAAMRKDHAEKRVAGETGGDDIIWRIPFSRNLFFTGLRGSEGARVRWREIDTGRGLIMIRKQKSNKEQTIPLNGAARDVLKDVPTGRPDDYVFRPSRYTEQNRNARYFRENMNRRIVKYGKKAKIDRPLTLHGLRRGFCTALAAAGKSAAVIKEAARHADISTFMEYVHMENEHLKAELEDVFERD